MTAVNICFQMIVYQSDYVLEEAIRSILPFGPLVVTEGPCGYWREIGKTTSTDRTNDILNQSYNYDYDIIGVVRGQWAEKDEMVNASLHLVPADTTHLFVVDADEVWRSADLRHVISLLEEWDLDSMGFTADSFFGGFERILMGFERHFEVVRVQRWYPDAKWKTHRPPTIEDATGMPWQKRRHMGHAETHRRGIAMPHYSYVFPRQVYDKHYYYEHYTSGQTIPNYPTEVYLPWVLGDDDKKYAIEARWRGIHNFVPAYRGDCYSSPFHGTHPEEIVKSMDRLQGRFRDELEWLKEQRDQSAK